MRYQVETAGEDRVSFPYTIPVGPLTGREIRLGFLVPGDFPLTPPSGPHVSARLHPLQSGGSHPNGGILDSSFGPDWQYWSRPHPNWASTDRTVRAYLAHVRQLFATQ